MSRGYSSSRFQSSIDLDQGNNRAAEIVAKCNGGVASDRDHCTQDARQRHSPVLSALPRLSPEAAKSKSRIPITSISQSALVLTNARQCLSLLRQAAREYYPLPSSHCTTWSYFTPLRSKGAPLIAGMEIYTQKSALQRQVDDPVYFQSYHHTVQAENLYEKPEELQACYLAAGFVTREGKAQGRGKVGEGVVVSITRMESGKVDEVLATLREFAKWVEVEEPGVLTYAAFTRSKVRREVILFVRYEDQGWLKRHGEAPEHVAVV